MEYQELEKMMTRKKEGVPIKVLEVNGSYIVGIYKGALSPFDILIKYRQKMNGKWSLVRTPKHIHWATDILIKLHEDEKKTKDFLDFLLEIWNTTQSVKSIEQQEKLLSIEVLFKDSQEAINKYEELSNKGEYSIKFLILLAKLLMIQEKANMEDAYMFKRLLERLKNKGDIFSVVSIASHTGRRK